MFSSAGPSASRSPNECLAIQIYVPPEKPELHTSASRSPNECLALQIYQPPEESKLHESALRSPAECLAIQLYVPPEEPEQLQEPASRSPDEQLPVLPDEPTEADLSEPVWGSLDDLTPLQQYERELEYENVWKSLDEQFPLIPDDPAERELLNESYDRAAKRRRTSEEASTSGVNDFGASGIYYKP